MNTAYKLDPTTTIDASPTSSQRGRDIEYIFDAMSEGIVIQDVTGAVLDFNASAWQVLGIAADELCPNDASFRYAPLFECARQALVSGVTQLRPALRLTDGNGQTRVFSVTASPIVTGSDAASIRVLTIFRDISAEQRDLTDREVTRTLDSIPTPMAFFDADVKLVHANAQYAAIFGFTKEQVRGRAMVDILGVELFNRNAAYLADARNGKCASFEREVTFANKTASMFVTYAPDVRDGLFNGFYVFVVDVTHLRSVEKERAKLESRLIASSKMTLLGEMAGGIAHEINNPLSIIGGTASVLKIGLESKRLDEKTLANGLEKIDLTVQRIAKIIRGLRIFARDADRDPMVRASLDTIVGETLELCQEKVRTRGIKLKSAVPPHSVLTCNPTQISQILMNLINNAVDALQAAPEKWIELRVERTGDRLHVFVTDSGGGITREVSDRMFNPFFTTKALGNATGLGLSISKGLAEDNHGTLTYVADSARTCFLLDLPAVTKDAGQNPP